MQRALTGRVRWLFLGAATVSAVVVGLVVWTGGDDEGLPFGGLTGDVARVEDSARVAITRGSTSLPQRNAAKAPARDIATLRDSVYVLIAPGAGPVPEARSSPAKDVAVLSAVAAWTIFKPPAAPSGGGEKTKLEDRIVLVVRGGDGEVKEEIVQ